MASSTDIMKHILIGAAGGLAGTVVIQALMGASGKVRPSSLPPLRQDPGEFMVEQAEGALSTATRESIPDWAETAAARGLGLGYGLTFGALYGALRPRGGSWLWNGVALGVATWAAGYLGWLPALGLMPPVWKQEPEQAIAPVVEHALYGMVTVAAYDAIQDAMATS
jgi:hypothetical protein